MRVAFITNICPHYRVKTFETLAKYFDLDFYFYSAGNEWYWQRQHGVKSGSFQHEYLSGISVGGTRITPTLPFKLWSKDYDVYVKCINGRFALPATMLAARLRGKPVVLWTGVWMRLQSPAHRLMFPFTRYVYRHADAIVVYGDHVKRYLISEGVPAERIFAAHHAVDNSAYNVVIPEVDRRALRDRLRAGDRKIVLYLGRIEAGKGLDYLIDAFAAVRDQDALLVLAGDGSERPRLEQLARERGIAERARFVGYVPSDQTMAFYAVAWVYVLPSITTPLIKETWGLVVNEAMNQGTPVIASDAVGAAAGGLVVDGKNGFVVPERDAPAITRALNRVLGESGLRDQLGDNARRIVATWDNERMVRGFRDAIECVTSKRARP
jgi:glycosyltransferase involved in cell wall biosynthesis